MNTKIIGTNIDIGCYVYPAWGPQPIVVSATVNGNRVEIVRRVPSNSTMTCNPPRRVPDKVWKEIYEIEDGCLVQRLSEQGTHTPEHTVPETITWEDSE
jgi:hypothetical protein